MNYKKILYYFKRVKNSPAKFLVKKFNDKLKKDLLYRFKYKNYVYKTSFISDGKINITLSDDELNYLRSRVYSVIDSGKWSCLGYGFVDVSSSRCFTTDDVHGFSWDNKFFSDIDFLSIHANSDVKIAWEKSRLQFLSEVALYIANIQETETKNDLKNFYLSKLKEWENQNPFLYSVNWVSSMEVAIRAINIIFSYYLISDQLSEQEKLIVSNILHKHLIYIKLFPEYSDVPGNHYIATLCGLAVLNNFFNLDNSEVNKELLNQMDLQFNQDSMHYEHSPLYHRLCIELLLSIFVLSKYNSIQLLEFTSKISRYIQVIVNLADHNSFLLPVIADSDSGFVFDFGQLDRDVSYFQNNEGDVASSIIKKIYSCSKQIQDRHFPFTDLNSIVPFFVVRSRELAVFFKAGPLGLKGRASHDHDDNLSYWVFNKGLDFIVEAGTFPYTLSIDERELCIASSSHNVIFPIVERNKYKQGSIYKTVENSSQPDYIEADKNRISASLMFKDQEFKHQRELTLGNNELVINDTILNNGLNRDFISRIHFSKHCNFCCMLDKSLSIYFKGEFIILTVEDINSVEFQFGFFTYGLKYGAYEQGQTLSIKFNCSTEFSYSLKFKLTICEV